MITWWIHLSCSHAALVLLTILLLIGAVICWFAPVRPDRQRPGAIRERQDSYTVDYSREYQNKVVWLGERYLLAKPINRRRREPRPAPWDGAIVPGERS